MQLHEVDEIKELFIRRRSAENQTESPENKIRGLNEGLGVSTGQYLVVGIGGGGSGAVTRTATLERAKGRAAGIQ